MAQKNTIESLISTSGEEEWDTLPFFYQGKIIKRISKEEIQGWNQRRLPQPFQKVEPHHRKGRRSIAHTKQSPLQQNFDNEPLSPPPSLKTIKKKLIHYDNNQNLFKAFRNLNQVPLPKEELALPKVAIREEPKEDFVKGIKFANFTTIPKKTNPVLKPLFQAFCESTAKNEKIRCKSVTQRGKNAYKKSNFAEKQVSIISYPMDVLISQLNEAPSHNKLHNYMRKYQIDVFQN